MPENLQDRVADMHEHFGSVVQYHFGPRSRPRTTTITRAWSVVGSVRTSCSDEIALAAVTLTPAAAAAAAATADDDDDDDDDVDGSDASMSCM